MQEHNVQETQERQEPEEVQVPVPKVGFVSLGCAKNQVNCEQMIWKTYEAGYEVALGAEGCDVAVVNTCGFLKEARDEAMGEIDKLVRQKQAGNLKKIIVTGCMAQWWHDQLAERCPGADGFVGVGSYQDIAKVIDEALEGQRPALFGDINAPVPETDRVVCTSDHWAWLRIAEGCDNHCTFCAIPEMQGPYRSRAREDILAEAEMLARRGVKELIVIAQDITTYGLDNYGRLALPELLHDLCKIDGIRWIRLLYAYPNNLSDDLIATIASEEKICKYIDIPLQHADDEILARMNRKIDQAQIRALIAKLRERVPGIMIRSTFIVGFPGETEADFQDTLDLVETCQFDNAFSFIYSPRPGTAAAKFDDQIPLEVSKERLQRLMDEYAGGVSQFYRTNEERLDYALKHIAMLQSQFGYLRARDLHELMQAHETMDRVDVAETVVHHLKARKETRWAGWQTRSDYPERDDANFDCFIESRRDPATGKVETFTRPYEQLIPGDRYTA